MSTSYRVKDLFGDGTYFGILVNAALELRIGIQVIPGNMLVFPCSLILRDRLLNSFSLEHSCQPCPLALEGWCLVHQVQVFAFQEDVASLESEEGPGLEELEPEDLVPCFDGLFFLLPNVW
jgi:hypothetical protein